MQVQLRPAYIPWLFDNREAWENSVRDSRYRYDMSFDAFMAIYLEYKNNRRSLPSPSAISSTPVQSSAPSAPAPSAAPSGAAGQLLSQNEIDDLISAMAH